MIEFLSYSVQQSPIQEYTFSTNDVPSFYPVYPTISSSMTDMSSSLSLLFILLLLGFLVGESKKPKIKQTKI